MVTRYMTRLKTNRTISNLGYRENPSRKKRLQTVTFSPGISSRAPPAPTAILERFSSFHIAHYHCQTFSFPSDSLQTFFKHICSQIFLPLASCHVATVSACFPRKIHRSDGPCHSTSAFVSVSCFQPVSLLHILCLSEVDINRDGEHGTGMTEY